MNISTPNCLSKFLSRKLGVFLLAFFSGVGLALAGKLDSTASNFICTLAGIYLAGNVINGYKDVVKKPQ